MADDNEVSKNLSDCIEKSGLSLFKIACEMSELLGSEISKTQIDSWINNKARFPFKYLPAFCVVVNSIEPLKYLAEKAGCNILNPEEAAILELKNIEYQRSILEAKEKYIKEILNIISSNII